MSELLFKEESYRIIGACFKAYNEMRCGFLEAVYQECLAREFELSAIPFQSQLRLPIRYKQELLAKYYEADFICFDENIVEIKAVHALGSEHASQVLNYLNATGKKLGILVNFGAHPKLQYKRFANSH